ncbi:TetR/AcrR family transcriptional regulator [Novosphingobium sp. AAP83]|uniref:TetR/AcrR family transcriptional regulator n=1 Tax=Novosphingobium sp. AAP83 TaxID=1523425 RepID=UPI000A44B98D|nr:TetR/AcrR family transcriptional regulator [Novosphingobium sp. AAP83]
MNRSKKDRILDAAEQLFSERGFDGVSMRNVADTAEVGLGLVTYHFTTKDVLFEDVVTRRAEVLNSERRKLLSELDNPSLEELLEAFFEPYRRFIASGSKGWRAYARLHAILTQDSRWTDLAARSFGAVALEMVERIMMAEPAISRGEAVRGYVHVIGIMVSVFAETGLIDRFSDGAISSRDVATSISPMVRFGAAGIRALAISETAASAPLVTLNS